MPFARTGFTTAKILGRQAIFGGTVGATANLAGLFATEENVTTFDVGRKAFTGFIDGALGTKLPGFRGAGIGGFTAELVDQFIAQDFENSVSRLLLASTFSVGGEFVSKFTPSSLSDTLDFGIGVGFNIAANSSTDSLDSVVQDLLESVFNFSNIESVFNNIGNRAIEQSSALRQAEEGRR